jgi:hypothetical protein
MDETPAIDDPNLDIGSVIVESLDDRLMCSLLAEGDLEYDAARQLADDIEADIEQRVRVFFEDGDGE